MLEHKQIVNQSRDLIERQAAPVVGHFSIFDIGVKRLDESLRVVVHPSAVVPVEVYLQLPWVKAVGSWESRHHSNEPYQSQDT